MNKSKKICIDLASTSKKLVDSDEDFEDLTPQILSKKLKSSMPLNVLEKYELCITLISPEVSEHKSGMRVGLVFKLIDSVVVTLKGYLAISRCSFLVSRYTFYPHIIMNLN